MEKIHKDTSARSAREKTVANRPADLVDGCWKDQTFIKEAQAFGHEGTTCNNLWGSYGNPRFVAGGPLAADIIKCQMKPVSAADYKVTFTPEELARAKRVFAGGVCDWSKPGVGQGKVVPWASFGPAPENLVFDITRPQSSNTSAKIVAAGHGNVMAISEAGRGCPGRLSSEGFYALRLFAPPSHP